MITGNATDTHEQLSKRSKWSICIECGYRITERDEKTYDLVKDAFKHDRCTTPTIEVSSR